VAGALRANPLRDPSALFRFHEDEKEGALLLQRRRNLSESIMTQVALPFGGGELAAERRRVWAQLMGMREIMQRRREISRLWDPKVSDHQAGGPLRQVVAWRCAHMCQVRCRRVALASLKVQRAYAARARRLSKLASAAWRRENVHQSPADGRELNSASVAVAATEGEQAGGAHHGVVHAEGEASSGRGGGGARGRGEKSRGVAGRERILIKFRVPLLRDSAGDAELRGGTARDAQGEGFTPETTLTYHQCRPQLQAQDQAGSAAAGRDSDVPAPDCVSAGQMIKIRLPPSAKLPQRALLPPLPSGSKRRKVDPKRALNTIFEAAVQAMWDENTSLPFRSEVKCTAYRARIPNRMDLSSIKNRCYGLGCFDSSTGLCHSEALYDSKEEFVADVALMVSNCRTYNEDRDPQLVSDVLALERICHAKLEENKSAIAAAAAMIVLSSQLAAWTAALMTSEFEAFFEPMTTKAYTAVVRRPMALRTMMGKAGSCSYRSQEGWLEDLRLVRDNCYLFCASRYPNLPPVADRLLARGEELAGEGSSGCQTAAAAHDAQRRLERERVRERQRERERKREREREKAKKRAREGVGGCGGRAGELEGEGAGGAGAVRRSGFAQLPSVVTWLPSPRQEPQGGGERWSARWTREEDAVLTEAEARLQSNWAEVAKLLPGRSATAAQARFGTMGSNLRAEQEGRAAALVDVRVSGNVCLKRRKKSTRHRVPPALFLVENGIDILFAGKRAGKRGRGVNHASARSTTGAGTSLCAVGRTSGAKARGEHHATARWQRLPAKASGRRASACAAVTALPRGLEQGAEMVALSVTPASGSGAATSSRQPFTANPSAHPMRAQGPLLHARTADEDAPRATRQNVAADAARAGRYTAREAALLEEDGDSPSMYTVVAGSDIDQEFGIFAFESEEARGSFLSGYGKQQAGAAGDRSMDRFSQGRSAIGPAGGEESTQACHERKTPASPGRRVLEAPPAGACTGQAGAQAPNQGPPAPPAAAPAPGTSASANSCHGRVEPGHGGQAAYGSPELAPGAHEAELVGERVRVWWDGEEDWFAGYVSRYCRRKKRKPHFVQVESIV